MVEAGRDKPVIVLFRHDLRVADNRALTAAAETGKPVLCAFVLDEASEGVRPMGAARRWWLHHSLLALTERLRSLGSPLALRRGPTSAVVDSLVSESGAETVFWNRRYDPAVSQNDARMKAALRQRGVVAESFEGELLHEPTRLLSSSGRSYRVFTPFWRALETLPDARPPLPPPARLRPPGQPVASDSPGDWDLLPVAPDWAAGFAAHWQPGEAGAQRRLAEFIYDGLARYDTQRDHPGRPGTSRLSPHLAHGEITPFQLHAAIRSAASTAPTAATAKLRSELGWREFAYHLLVHHPAQATENFNPAFDGFGWRADAAALRAWQRGTTGYPIVDAAMRELWLTGWMHNRARMVAASFLVKHLLADWREGERWFWDTLVDADPANNPAGWQWVAGSGADAAPYFRIFNPMLQGERFDAAGTYVRRFVPEISGMPDRYLHRPWQAPRQVLDAAGVKLGENYPVPVVEHEAARQRALQAYHSLRGNR